MDRGELKNLVFIFFFLPLIHHVGLLLLFSIPNMHSHCRLRRFSSFFIFLESPFYPESISMNRFHCTYKRCTYVHNTLHGEQSSKQRKGRRQKKKMIITITPSQMAWKASRKNYGFYNAFYIVRFQSQKKAQKLHVPDRGRKDNDELIFPSKRSPPPAIKNQLISKLKVAVVNFRRRRMRGREGEGKQQQ